MGSNLKEWFRNVLPKIFRGKTSSSDYGFDGLKLQYNGRSYTGEDDGEDVLVEGAIYRVAWVEEHEGHPADIYLIGFSQPFDARRFNTVRGSTPKTGIPRGVKQSDMVARAKSTTEAVKAYVRRRHSNR